MIKLDIIQNIISKELKALNDIIVQSLESSSPLMQEIVQVYLKTKGKQIRPVLVLLSAKTFGPINTKALNAAAAIEMLHNASLIHDDVVDDSKKRRGYPTINSIWDNHVAVLVGDFFVSNALQKAIDTGEMRIIRSMSDLSKELAMGEIDQINNARMHNINEEVYFNIIKHKTASLFRSCVEVGGYAVGATNEEIAPLKRYAELLGSCFQIKDDIFDYFDDKEVGKPTGNDLREGKITLPLIYALSKTEAAGRREALALSQKDNLSQDEISTLIDFTKRQGGIEYAYTTMETIRKEANKILSYYAPSPSIDAFKEIFDYIIERDK